MLKPQTPLWCGGRSFYRQNMVWGLRVCDFLLIGWRWDSRVVFQECCAQTKVTILHLIGGLSSCQRIKDIVTYIPGGGTRTLIYCCPKALPLFLHSFPSMIAKCLNLSLGTQGKSRMLNESYFLSTRNGGHWKKDLYLGGPYRVLLGFIITHYNYSVCHMATMTWKSG